MVQVVNEVVGDFLFVWVNIHMGVLMKHNKLKLLHFILDVLIHVNIWDMINNKKRHRFTYIE